MVFPAETDGGQDIAGNKEQQEDVVQFVVVMGVENRQQNQAAHADNGKQDAEAREDLLLERRVGHQSSVVTQQALRGKGQVEKRCRDGRAGDEERFQLGGTNVADERNVVALVHVRVVLAVCVDDPVEEEAEEHAEPDEAGDHWEYLQPWLEQFPSREHNKGFVTYPV